MLENFTKLIDGLVGLVSGGIATLLMTVAFAAFLAAVINYIWKRRQGDAGGLKQAGNMLFGSVFGLFVMVAVWGIVNFIGTNVLGSDFDKKTITKPQTIWTNTPNSSTGSSASGRPACDTFTNGACPSLYCKVDTFDECVNK